MCVYTCRHYKRHKIISLWMKFVFAIYTPTSLLIHIKKIIIFGKYSKKKKNRKQGSLKRKIK